MITTIVHTDINPTTWYEFHDYRNDNSMGNITDRVIRHYDIYHEMPRFRVQLHELCHSIQKAIEESIKRKYN